jgi:alpha-N-arabinofuranosidase
MNAIPSLRAFFQISILACLAAGGSRLLAQPTITVDASHVVRTVDERIFGVNTAIWDSQLQGSQTVPLLKAADVRALRFPGGSASDGYNWQTREGGSGSWQPGFDDFAAIATALNAQVFLTINYGSGNVKLAADWVTYANVTKRLGFKYWEIGNENYGSWENDTHPVGQQWDPVTYANEAKNYLAAMRAVDPTIKIGLVAQAGEDQLDSKSPVHNVTNPRTGLSHHGWTPVMLATLKSLGVTPDYLIYHRYEQAPGQESDAALLQAAATWSNDATNLRQQLTDYLGAAGASVELLVTENNSVYSDPGKQIVSLVNGLYLLDSVGQLLQTEINAMLWWDLRNGQDTKKNNSASLYGWRMYGDYGILSPTNEPYPNYYAMKLLKYFARGGDKIVTATSTNNLVQPYAALRADGTLSVLVINKQPLLATTPTITVTGFAPLGSASVHSYGIAQDEAARTGVGSTDLAVSTMSGLGASFQATVAQYSATVITLAPLAPGSPPTQFYGYASGATEVTLSWQPPTGKPGLTGYKLDRATDSAFTQGLTTVNLGVVTSYFDTGLLANTAYYYRVSAVNAGGASSPTAAVNVTTFASLPTGTAKIVNIATRAYCSTGNNVTIGGFVIAGNAAKRVLVRAVGPSLTAQGLGATEVLADPTIEVHDAIHGNVIVATNDNWGDNTNASAITTVGASIGAAAFQSGDTKSAALLMPLAPGVYSFVVKGNGNSSGIVLLEVYDADATDNGSSFVNIATRADCTTNNGVTIGGFVVSGAALKHVLVRAVGPTLTTQGIGATEVLQDPTIELHDAIHGNVIIATNDNWGDNANALAIASTGARIGATPFASGDTTSSALLLALPAGVYSFVARGQANASGIVLVEVYDAD